MNGKFRHYLSVQPGTLLEFNTRKKRIGIMTGDIKDCEAGTFFYERRYKNGTSL